MDRQGYKSIKQALKKIDRDRDTIHEARLRRMEFMDRSIEPRGGGGGTAKSLIKCQSPHLNFHPF